MSVKEIYIISELCGQYGGSLRRAEQMILQSKMGGANAVKVQLYDTYRMPGDNRQLWEYLSIKEEELLNIKKIADSLNIDFFASVFHEDRLDWTQKHGLRINKIASSLLKSDWKLCEKIVNTGYLTFCSLGKWEENNFPFDNDNVIYLHCVCEYPHNYERAMELMPQKFEGRLMGYSDHCIGIETSKEAIKRGALYIEKHFTTNHNLACDTEKAHSCSMNYKELTDLRNFADEYVRKQ